MLARLSCVCLIAALAAPLIASEIITEPTITTKVDGETRWYADAAQVPGYADATAHNPGYDVPGLWHDRVKKSLHAKQEWPKVRVLVWANPGKSAKDGFEAKHWLEDGKPATAPIDENTDLVLPDAKGNYWVSVGNGKKYQAAKFRHLTVGSKAAMVGHFAMRGNLWVKRGGTVQYLDSAVGGDHCFWRIDNIISDHDRRSTSLVDHFHFKKEAGSSQEFIGLYRSEDNWQFHSGLFIIGPDSEIGMGSRTPPKIADGAAVALMDGAKLSRRENCDWQDDLTVIGTLTAGLEDRPLKRDARLALGWKSKGKAIDSTKGGHRKPGPDDVGMVVQESGVIKVFSTDPKQARLIINCNKRDPNWGQIEIITRKLPVSGEEAKERMQKIPRLTDMVIKGTVDWTGIVLDDIRTGGIKVPTVPKIGSADAPVFGDHNEAAPADLFAPLQ
jgi:hypothetical protein